VRIGVATAGFQVEGGFNAFGQPTNNWADWELHNRADPSGPALRFWDRPHWLLDRAAAAGCDRFRLSIEWARIQPGFDIADTGPPPVDDTSLDGYASIVAACRERGMEPMVTLHHFTHPRWAGVGFWDSAASLPAFDDYVRIVVEGLGARLVAGGQEPVTEWITLNELNGLAIGSTLAGLFPAGGRRSPARMVRWIDHLLAAHCRAYDIVHDVHAAMGWPVPAVSTNNYVMTSYHLDRMLTDLLLARDNGIDRDELGAWLVEGEADWREALRRMPGLPAEGLNGRVERWLGGAAARLVTTDRLTHTVETIYRSRRHTKLDYIAIDWYDPSVGRSARWPGRVTPGGRRWHPQAGLDEQVANPPGLTIAIEAARRHAGDRPVVVVESGLCNQWPVGGSVRPRPDGATRAGYLEDHLPRAAAAGAAGYYHWTIADNYEWGSYTPRFGLHAVDRDGSHIRILDHDAFGDDSAGTFRRLVDDHRAGSPSSGR
jgi:beta-glucosidase/6-phospho-beta-glucosidase/beta-galactosidase